MLSEISHDMEQTVRSLDISTIENVDVFIQGMNLNLYSNQQFTIAG